MIKINLIGVRKKNKLPTVLGVDLNTINYKLIIAAYLLTLVGESTFKDHILKENQGYESQIAQLQAQLAGVQEEIKQFDNTRDELEKYNQQVERLRQRSTQVVAIINQKSNPKPALSQISQYMPEDMWIDYLEIRNDGALIIKGGSQSYVSVGNFIMTANESPLFENINLSETNTQEIRERSGVRRLEAYIVEGRVNTTLGWTQ